MRRTAWLIALPFSAAMLGGCARAGKSSASASVSGAALPLWKSGDAAFGMFVPDERVAAAPAAGGTRLPPLYTENGARALAKNPLLDFLFLNLEGGYDAQAVRAMVSGLTMAAAATRPTLLVRIPTIADAGVAVTRARVKEVLGLGADGVVIPHVRSAAEARTAAAFFSEAGVKVWSPMNPKGTRIAMLMVEDKGAIAELAQIASVPGYSLLSCGIGSLTRDMGGDAPGAEAACRRARDLGAKAGMPSMMTATAGTIKDRIEKGYLGLLLAGTADQAAAIIRSGRTVARQP